MEHQTERTAASLDTPASNTYESKTKREEMVAPRPRDERLTRVLGLTLMAVATIGSAWGGFQAGLWNGIQVFRLADATKLSRLSVQNVILSTQQKSLDAATFMELARAVSEKNSVLADFVLERARPEFRPALDAWLATKPLKNKDAPATPFTMREYKLKAEEDRAAQEQLSNAKYDEAQKANLNGDRYTLAVLVFTSALFLAGLITGFDDAQIRWISVILSVTLICIAIFIVARLPVAHLG